MLLQNWKTFAQPERERERDWEKESLSRGYKNTQITKKKKKNRKSNIINKLVIKISTWSAATCSRVNIFCALNNFPQFPLFLFFFPCVARLSVGYECIRYTHAVDHLLPRPAVASLSREFYAHFIWLKRLSHVFYNSRAFENYQKGPNWQLTLTTPQLHSSTLPARISHLALRHQPIPALPHKSHKQHSDFSRMIFVSSAAKKKSEKKRNKGNPMRRFVGGFAVSLQKQINLNYTKNNTI